MIIFDNKPYQYRRFVLRLVDLSMIGILYFIGGVCISNILNNIFHEYDKEVYDNTPTYKIVLELFLHSSLIMILAWMLRSTVYKIPFPLDGLWGYNHSKLSEIKGGILISFSIFVLLTDFRKKIIHLSRQSNFF